MKFLMCSVCIVAILIPLCLSAEQKFRPGTEIENVVPRANDVYKKEGLSGLIGLSEKAYNDLNKRLTTRALEDCVGIDMFGHLLDSEMAKIAGWDTHPYFEADSFQERIFPYFMKMGMTMNQANDFLNLCEVAVKKQMGILARAELGRRTATSSKSIQLKPDHLLRLRVGISYFGSRDIADNLTLEDFVGGGLPPGVWERVEADRWVYRMTVRDPLTKSENELALLFTKNPTEDIVFLEAMASDGERAPWDETIIFFTTVAGILTKAAKERTETQK